LDINKSRQHAVILERGKVTKIYTIRNKKSD